MLLSRSIVTAVSIGVIAGTLYEVSAEQTLPDLAEAALKSVVRVQTFDEQGEPLANGSAFFISEDGRLVTNRHLVEGASSAVVHLSSGAVFGVDGVLGVSETNDLAVLKISGERFPSLELGEGTGLRVGQQVVAIGNPLGREGTVSSGIVSAIRSGDDCEGLAVRCIQTTAPVSPGSSGGPLLDMDGKVIGIASALVPGGQSLNFAVSVDLLASLLSERQTLQELSALHTPWFLGTSPTRWTSTADGTEWLIRRLDGTIYAERLVTGNLAERGFSTVCEYEYRGAERSWEGLCRVRAPVECSGRWRVCAFEVPDTLVSVKPERITGIALAPQDLVCATCTVTSSEWTDFTLLPKQGPSDALERSGGPADRDLPARPEGLRADIQGKVIERSEQSWTFSWAISLTSTYLSPLTADATVEFLDATGLVIAFRREYGLQVPADSSVTFRGVTALEPTLASQVERLGVKIQAKNR